MLETLSSDVESRLPAADARPATTVRPAPRQLALPHPLRTLSADLQAVMDRDPAARNLLEIVVCYPGLHAIWGYRVAHALWTRNFKLLGRWLSQMVRGFTGIEIHPGATIGSGFFIDHGMGVVIGETAEVGANVTLYHGVTLGGVSLQKGKRHPTLEDNVVVGAGAKILGAITVGHGSRIGANAVVVKPVPPDSVVVGVPGEVVVRSRPRTTQKADLDHNQMPDVLGDAVVALMGRVGELELELQTMQALHAQLEPPPVMHAPDHGLWHGEDFAI